MTCFSWCKWQCNKHRNVDVFCPDFNSLKYVSISWTAGSCGCPLFNILRSFLAVSHLAALTYAPPEQCQVFPFLHLLTNTSVSFVTFHLHSFDDYRSWAFFHIHVPVFFWEMTVLCIAVVCTAQFGRWLVVHVGRILECPDVPCFGLVCLPVRLRSGGSVPYSSSPACSPAILYAIHTSRELIVFWQFPLCV